MRNCGVPSLDNFFNEFKKATKTFITNQTKYDKLRNTIFESSEIDMKELDYSVCIAIKGLVTHCYRTAATLKGKDIKDPDTWFKVTDGPPFVEMKLLKDVMLYKTLGETYPLFIAQLVICLKDTPPTLTKLKKMKRRAMRVKNRAKKEIDRLPTMKKMGAMKNFAVNMNAMMKIIMTVKKALPMYAGDMVSLKDSVVALKNMLASEEGRAECKQLGEFCAEVEGCDSIC